MLRQHKLMSIAAAAILLLAACGDEATPAGDDAAEEDTALPTDDSPDSDDSDGDTAGDTAGDSAADCADGAACDDAVTPDPAGATCLAGSTDCADDPTTLSPGAGMIVDGGLSVADALSKTAQDGIVAVGGMVYVSDDGVFLCDEIDLTGPAACAGDALTLAGLDPDTMAVPFQTVDGVQVSEGQITLLGIVDNGVMTIDPLSN